MDMDRLGQSDTTPASKEHVSPSNWNSACFQLELPSESTKDQHGATILVPTDSIPVTLKEFTSRAKLYQDGRHLSSQQARGKMLSV